MEDQDAMKLKSLLEQYVADYRPDDPAVDQMTVEEVIQDLNESIEIQGDPRAS